MNPLISIIVPIYNVEQYLAKCIESIINQTYKNIEIILVNDGSPDNSAEICWEYAKRDNRIRIINKKNGGLSDARNVGVKSMTGEYLMFVDSDDWLETDCVQLLYELLLKYQADLAIGGVKKFDDETGKVIWTTQCCNETDEICESKQEAMKDMLQNGCAAWARLYKREIHQNILFPVGEINEDEAIALKILDRCNRIIKTNKVIYNYRYRSQSITSTTWHIKKLDWNKHCKQNVKYIDEKYPELKEYADARYITSLIWALNNMTRNVKKYGGHIKTYRNELRYMKKKSKLQNLSYKEKLRLWMLLYMYYPYAGITRLLGKHYT